MNATGLAARILYAAAALPAVFAVGFYATVYFLPKAAPLFGITVPAAQTEDLFRFALGVGAMVAAPAFLLALTLPWWRRRHRRGRKWRLAISAMIVLLVSLVFADMGHDLLSDLLLAAWLGCLLAFTFVRYGLLDQGSRRVLAKYQSDDQTASDD